MKKNLNVVLASLLLSGSVVFSQMYEIQTICGEHGSIVPSGTIKAAKGDSLQFRFIPEAGYKFTNVKIDTVASPFSWSTYTFKNISSNHTISVGFEKSFICGYTELEGRHLWKAGGTVPENTISPDQLEYKGAFRLPDGGTIPSTWAYGGLDFAYYPDGNKDRSVDGYPGSLFGIGHVYGAMGSEVSIPKPVISNNINDLNVATVIQPFKPIFSGVLTNSNQIHGIEYLPKKGGQSSGKLYYGLGPTYIITGNHRYTNHGWSSTNLSEGENYGLWYVGGNDISSGWTGYYLFDIPDDISALLGGKCLATGRYRAGQGWGPHLYAIAPWDDGNPPSDGAVLSYINLLGYKDANIDSTSINDCRYNDFYAGIAWATCGKKSAVLFSAFMGYKAVWYDHEMFSDSSVTGIKFYNPQDLVDVALGKKQSYKPQPYATLDVTKYLFSNKYQKYVSASGNEGVLYKSGSLLGGAFDRKNSILYVCESNADNGSSIIHVWKIIDTTKSNSKVLLKNKIAYKIKMETIGQYLKLGISDYDNSKLYGSIKLGLFDLAGKRIVKSTISKDNPSIQVNISNLSKGMYFCKVEGKDFQIAKHVLICKL